MADRLFMYSWYHGEIGRALSENVLVKQKAGYFLVRDSSTCKGGYVLSVSENNKVSHYIITNKNGQYQIGDQTFDDLPDIVEFYKRHFLDTTTLIESAPRQATEAKTETEQAPPASTPAQQNETFKVKARYNFPGNDPEDLPFKKGDILTVFKKEEEQWWMAQDSAGREGMIPANYVELVPNRSSMNTASGQSPVGIKTNRTSVKSGGGGYTTPSNNIDPTIPSASTVTVPAIAEAVQDRTPTIYDPYELKFQKGERILVLNMRDDGSWEGQLKNGKKGIFPFRYVKIISSDPEEVLAFSQ